MYYEDEINDARSLLIDAARELKATHPSLFTQILDYLYDRDTWVEAVASGDTEFGYAEWQIHRYEDNY